MSDQIPERDVKPEVSQRKPASRGTDQRKLSATPREIPEFDLVSDQSDNTSFNTFIQPEMDYCRTFELHFFVGVLLFGSKLNVKRFVQLF